MDNFGSRLRKVLEHHGLSADRLAKEIDFSNAATLNLLSGKTHPSYEFLIRLMELYPDVNSNWLLLGRETMFMDPNIRPKSISHYSPDLIESKNEVIAALNDNIRMKAEKIEFLISELRECKAAANLLSEDKTNNDSAGKKGRK
jgi:transcriptional regulator with XRE-family HTH domain